MASVARTVGRRLRHFSHFTVLEYERGLDGRRELLVTEKVVVRVGRDLEAPPIPIGEEDPGNARVPRDRAGHAEVSAMTTETVCAVALQRGIALVASARIARRRHRLNGYGLGLARGYAARKNDNHLPNRP